MRLSYQVATPDVKRGERVTSYQGNLNESFKALSDNGYEGIELMVSEPDQIDIKSIKSLSKEYNLPVSMICTGEIFGQRGISFTDKDINSREKAISSVIEAIDLALNLDCNIVNIGRVRGGFSLDGDYKKERELSVEGIKTVAEYALKKNVIIALEPVNSIAATFINSTNDGIDIIKEINLPSLKLMLDSNHMFLDDIDPIESIEKAKEYTVFVHLADSNRLYPGNCKLDFEEFINKLYEVGYNGWVSVEVFQRPNQDVALKKSIELLKPILNGLKE